jgi:hypothetical protein
MQSKDGMVRFGFGTNADNVNLRSKRLGAPSLTSGSCEVGETPCRIVLEDSG